jgi:hypothetical protein
MAQKIRSRSAPSAASSWWSERSKITAKKMEKTTVKPRAKKKIKTTKAAKAKTGLTYYCEVCGCEMICASDSSGEIICCQEPMCLVI